MTWFVDGSVFLVAYLFCPWKGGIIRLGCSGILVCWGMGCGCGSGMSSWIKGLGHIFFECLSIDIVLQVIYIVYYKTCCLINIKLWWLVNSIQIIQKVSNVRRLVNWLLSKSFVTMSYIPQLNWCNKCNVVLSWGVMD